MHLVRWSAAIENWHRIHYDLPFATHHEGLPSLLVNGSWKQHVIAQMLKDWAGPEGWVWKIRYQYRGQDLLGDTITASGRVVAKRGHEGFGLVECEVELGNHRGIVSTQGDAVIALPKREGSVPRPFVAPLAPPSEA
jgi:acyl dehydratase